VTLVVAAVVIAHAALTASSTVKITPLTVRVSSSAGLPDGAAATLFDRDTTGDVSIDGPTQIETTLEAPTEIRAVKLFGQAPCVVTVAAETASGWQTLIGPATVIMTAAPRRWVTLTAAVPLTTGRLRFDFAGAGAGTIPALSEIEIWGAGARTPIKSGADLDAAMSGPTPPLQGRRYAATPASGTIGALLDEAPDDPADNSFHFSVDRSPRDFQRAWIVYEAVGLGHWVAAARSINHHAALGGIALTPGLDWSTRTEEIDPDWLQAGDNTVDFEAPDGSETKFGVRNLRCVAEMEDGSNFLKDIAFARSSRNQTQDYDTDTKSSTTKSPTSSTITNVITLTFDKPAQVETLILNVVGSVKGSVGVYWLVNGAWSSSGPTINGATLAIGTRQVATPSLVPVDGVRLSFASSPDFAMPIGDVVPINSGVGSR